MSKFITYRYEWALYDDAQGDLSPSQQRPPRYPPTLESFAAGSTLSVPYGYGTRRLTSAGASVPYAGIPNTNLVLTGDAANSTLVRVEASTPPVPGGSTGQLFFYVGPSQTVTLPGVLNPGSLTFQSVNTSFAVVSAAWGLTLFSHT